MLPTLSDKMGSNLQLLVPVTIAPSVMSARRNALLGLKKVDAIQVRCADKRDWFVLDVFADSTIEEEATQDNTRLRRPTASIERNLLAFTTLRNRVYDIAHEAHYSAPCEFCAGFLNFIVFGTNPDGFFVSLRGGKRLARTLAKFVEEVLALTVKTTFTDNVTRGCCSGQALIPQVVHEFFFSPTSYGA